MRVKNPLREKEGIILFSRLFLTGTSAEKAQNT